MSRPMTPSTTQPMSRPGRSNSQLAHETVRADGFDHAPGAPRDTSYLQQPLVDDRAAAGLRDGAPDLSRSNTNVSQGETMTPSRGGTLKKKASIKRGASLKRSGSRKSSFAGSVRSIQLGEREKYEAGEEENSAFYCPVPTSGSPTDVLVDRFQAWRKVLKDLIAYFRELQKANEARAKSVASAANTLINIQTPANFLSTGGLADAQRILKDFHKLAQAEFNKSRDLENEVILQLTGLRSDLQQKIKEIKGLSSDFKNSVAKEQEATRKAVRALQDALSSVDNDAATMSSKNDPFLVKMAVDRQLERQIEEENYLHRAYLNLEASGRELESIVVGEVQKAYNILTGIMKREADVSYETVEKLKEGPLSMPKAHEWDSFVTKSSSLVDPNVPVRQFEQIVYPGKDHPAATEVRAGMLERKSKYLKNYTPGWYVLSPTHLHEFKSADRISSQSPIMSLSLPEQKLGTHSEPGSSSHKFMLKGRQTGTMHRGHSWIFRAETHDTMLQWYGDIKELTEKRGEERNAFIRRSHARTLSGSSMKAPSIRSHESGMEEDEIDRVPFSSEQSIRGQSITDRGSYTNSSAAALGTVDGAAYDDIDDSRSEAGWRPQRPTPGGRFPSDLNVQRGLQAPLSPSSGDSVDIHDRDRDGIAAANALPGSGFAYAGPNHYSEAHDPPHGLQVQDGLHEPGKDRAGSATSANMIQSSGQMRTPAESHYEPVSRNDTRSHHEYLSPSTDQAMLTGATVDPNLYDKRRLDSSEPERGRSRQQLNTSHGDESTAEQMAEGAIPSYGHSSVPIPVASTAPENAPTAPRAMRDPAVVAVPQSVAQYREPARSRERERDTTPYVERTHTDPSTASDVLGPHVPTQSRAADDDESSHVSIDRTLGVDRIPPSSSAARSLPAADENIAARHNTHNQIGVSQAARSQILANAGIQDLHTATNTAPASIYSDGPPLTTYATLPPRDASGNYAGAKLNVATANLNESRASNSMANAVKSSGVFDQIVLPERPAYRSAQSVTSIQDLHIPGEFPETPAQEYRPAY